MRKVNFNNLDNIEIPDSWADKVIKSPKDPKKDAPLVLFRFSRTLIAVASLVLICTLSVTLYFFAQKDSVLPVATPTIDTVENIDTTKATQNSSYTENSGKNYGSDTKPTVSDAQNPTLEPQESVSEAHSNPTEKETVKPTQIPSSKPTSPTNKPSAPAQKPTQKPTTPSDEPSIEPDGPEGPEDQPMSPENVLTFYGDFEEEKLKGSDKVYFSITETMTGDSWADEDQNPQKYPAKIAGKFNNKVYVEYYPQTENFVTKTGYYTYYFYNQDGEVIFTNTIYIQV